MKITSLVWSNEPPRMKNCVWAKPTSSGFSMYALEGGTWKPLQIVDNMHTNILSDDAIFDPYTVASTLSGILGTSDDTNLSLAGLRDALNATRTSINALIEANSLTAPTGDDAAGLAEYDPDAVTNPYDATQSGPFGPVGPHPTATDETSTGDKP